jgi:hypothetical protein
MNEIMEEISKARVDVVGVQEIRWQGLGRIDKKENIVKWIKGQRISWLGHLEGMEEDRMPKKIFAQEMEGTRRRGRPRKGWREEVERDLQVLGVRRWRKLVIDRENWRGIVRRTKVHSGLYRQGKKKTSATLITPDTILGKNEISRHKLWRYCCLLLYLLT